MYIRKEIRLVALLLNLPKGVDAHEFLRDLARKRKPCTISYDSSCLQDPTCMKGCIDGHKKIGVVPVEDKKYLKPLLDKSPTHSVQLEFLELYWDEEWAPILRYVIYVDLNDVQKDMPGEYWDGWNYRGLAKVKVDEWNCLSETIDYLRGVLIGSLPKNEDLDDVIKEIAHMCHYDISVEASVAIEDICFLLEMNHDERSDKWKNKLQRASTARRSKKTIMKFTEKWWPSFVQSNESISMFHTFLMRMKAKYKIMDKDNCIEQFKKEHDIIEEDLQSLPYGLYEYVEEPSMIFYISFYKKIPHEKMVDMFSALIMRCWMRSILNSKVETLGALMIPGAIKVDNLNILGKVESVTSNGNIKVENGDVNIQEYNDNSSN